MWKEFFTTLGAVILGGGGLGYFFRDRWTHRLSKELEEFKTSLAADLLEKQIRFGSLHSERIRILIPLYRMLLDVDAACKRHIGARLLVTDSESFATRAVAAWSKAKSALEDLVKFRRQNEVVLGPALAGQLDSLVDKYWDVVSGEGFGQTPNEAAVLMEGEIASLLNGVQQTIQKMLGVD